MLWKEIENTITAGNHECYVVGGFLRDLYLGRPVHDLDLVVESGALKLARELADRVGGSFVLLDAEHKIGRVICNDLQAICNTEIQNTEIREIDLAEFQGPSLEADLKARDFTVNALALPLNRETLQNLQDMLITRPQSEDWQLTREKLLANTLDPCAGLEDLKRKLIRAQSKEVFRQDPLRMLRAVRFSCQLGWPLEETTQAWITEYHEEIHKVSAERIRDEIFAVLKQPAAAAYVKAATDDLGLWPVIWPEIQAMADTEQNHHHAVDVWVHCLTTLESLERILANPRELPGDIRKGLFNQLKKPLGRCPRRRQDLLKWVALFHDVGKTRTKGRRPDGRITFYGHDRAGGEIIAAMAHRLMLGNKETQLAQRLVTMHMRPLQLYSLNQVSPKARFRFFRDLGSEAIEVLLLAMADFEAKVAFRGSREELADYRQFIYDLLRLYIRRPARIFPPKLISGKDIITYFPGLPHKLIGKILDEVYEAQGEGKVTTRAEALAWLEETIPRHYPGHS